MKTKRLFMLLATVTLCVSSAFISCSDDNDNDNSKELGDKAVEALQIRLLDENGDVVFGEPNEHGFYEIGIETQADAQQLVAQYAKNYKGDATPYLYTLPDTRGTVRVSKGEESGIYYNVEFKVKGIPQMTLQVVEPNYMEGDNKIKVLASYTCNNEKCKISFKLPLLAVPKCPSCGSTNVSKEQK